MYNARALRRLAVLLPVSLSTRGTAMRMSHGCVTNGVPNGRVGVDSEPLVTPDVMARMGTVWSRFCQLPDSIVTASRTAYATNIVVTVGVHRQLVTSVNMVRFAAASPAVAAVLTQAGITALQWEAERSALFRADLALHVGLADSIPSTSMLHQNIIFLRAHQEQLNALKATGMAFPKVPLTAEQEQQLWQHLLQH